MKIADFLGESLIDYNGKIASVVFAPSCNYHCPACHAKHLLQDNQEIFEEEIFSYLASRKSWIEAVVLSGGEPTLQEDILEFIKRLKKSGLAVKLDTNGYKPEVLEKLSQENLVDCVAMDIKSPRELYFRAAGIAIDIRRIEDSMRLVQKFPEYEFRTTIVPVLRDIGISFMTNREIGETAKWIYKITGKAGHKYLLQKFVPRKDGLLEPRLEEYSETPDSIMQDCLKAAKAYLPETKIR